MERLKKAIKSVALFVRLVPSEAKQVAAAAKREHLKASPFARKVLLDYIAKTKTTEKNNEEKP